MRLRIIGYAIALALGIVCLAGVTLNTAAAQSGRSFDRNQNAQAPRAPARIVVRPGRRLVRQCDSWYVIERRVAGDVLTPQMRCRWTYR